MPLTPLRTAGLVAAIAFAALTLRAYRRGRIGNGDLLLRLGIFVLPLLVLSADPGVLQWVFDELSFRKGGGHRILGATVLAVGVLYLFAFTLAGRGEKARRDLTRLIENLALEQFKSTGRPEQFAGGIALVIPAYNEAGNIAQVLGALPGAVCGYPLHAIAADDADVVGGSRVLGDADPSHAAREMGIKLFARLLSLLTWSRVSDPACGYRAVRTESLRGLEFRQDQFHNSEFIVEASKKKLRSIEVPVTVSSRLSGQSKKPPHFRYGMGFANALMRAW